MKPKMSKTKQLQEVPTVTPQKHVNKLANFISARSTPMKTPEESIGISDASLSAKKK